MIYRIFIFVVSLFLISCTQKQQFLESTFKKVELENVSLNAQLPIFSNTGVNTSKINELDKLIVFRNQFINEDLEFDLNNFKRVWARIQKTNQLKNTNSSELELWFNLTCFLFEITGETVFAEELEKLALLGIGKSLMENAEIVTPYIFTKNIDNLFVNIYTPATIIYDHTTNGKVKVEMETNYPRSGKVDLKFGMSLRRYIEVNIRIPNWAVGATVTVKKVKYFALQESRLKLLLKK